MKTNINITRVVFRKWKKSPKTIIAIFPDVFSDNHGNLLSYEHVGQHGGCSRLIVADTILATPDEYKDLFEELTSCGYILQVCKRISSQKQK